MGLGTIIDNVKDAIAASSKIIESAENDVAWLAYGPVLVFTTQFHLNEQAKALIGRGGRVRGVTEILPPYIEVISELIRIGEDVRHVKPFGGTSFMLIGDNKQCISSLRINVEDLSVEDQILAFWSKEPSYAKYLLSNFESAWTKGVDAQERISELLKEGADQNVYREE
jgi:hypothetical protein